ncbi:MAG: ABC transporter ATP-binding protein [Devosia sp. 67-54]|uniref:ABC transporter ATP-binding protein n=1 Tax=unclassified Devosia TaxID=196773 RepID=UPI00096A0885|nr:MULTISPECIES: ABC transporter ATP-binding protein [unclassified Devosia]MBN9307411.1 ABC transporter ATP-binding protein [Devosia sp.]OJX16799.1 MAG: ABC transporter ATP-binding protein [Devosia sp. 67-54]
MPTPLLDVRDLTVRLAVGRRQAALVDGLSFGVGVGEVLCIVGESGCGKTLTARAVIGLTRSNPSFSVAGQIVFEGENLLQLDERALRRVRGRRMGMIFQDPMTSLNPLHRIGEQLGEVLALHTDLDRAQRRARAIELLTQVGLPNPERRIDDYPHQFSGGMRQRAMIAMALACSPALLIADEPTTALDVTTQKQILDLILRLRTDYGMAVVLITHDLGVVAEIADRVMVMYAGECVETGSVREVFRHPRHPYTSRLLASIPSATRARSDELPSIDGAPPILTQGRPPGCAFQPRCSHAFAACAEHPPLVAAPDDATHFDRCWLPDEIKRRDLMPMPAVAS